MCHVIHIEIKSILKLCCALQKLHFRNERVIIHVHVYNLITFIFFSTPAGKRFLQLQQQVEALQEENFKVETCKALINLMVYEFNEIMQKKYRVKVRYQINVKVCLSQILSVLFHLVNVLYL